MPEFGPTFCISFLSVGILIVIVSKHVSIVGPVAASFHSLSEPSPPLFYLCQIFSLLCQLHPYSFLWPL